MILEIKSGKRDAGKEDSNGEMFDRWMIKLKIGPPWREIHFFKYSNKVDNIPIIIKITQNLDTDVTDTATGGG